MTMHVSDGAGPTPIRYREAAPDPRLASFVACYWAIAGSAPPSAAAINRILPDGCMDIIFDLGEPPPGHGRRSSRSFVVGAMRSPAVARLAGRVDTIGIRFRPGGAAAFVAPPATELTDRTVALDDLWSGGADDIESELAGATPFSHRVAALDRLLLRRLGGTSHQLTAVARASALIARSRGRIPVRDLYEAVGLSERHLERRFAELVGLTPKMACRVARLQHAVSVLLAEPQIGWSRLTHRCGYYDQAHLIREFKALAGLTPGAYRAERFAVGSVQYDPDGEALR